MNDYQKKEIQTLLAEYVKKFKSQKVAAESMTKVSEATIIQVKSNRWQSISDQMWINIGKQVGYSSNGKWNMAPTKPFNSLVKLFKTAQENSTVHAITVPAGRGKSFTINWYKDHHDNVFHIVCAKYMSNRELLSKILRKMNKEATGSASVMMDTIIEEVLKKQLPIIILDEFDKLRDEQKLFFITLYNMLEDYCSIVLIGTSNLEIQIKRRTGKHAIGFEEIYSRINRRFITIPDSSLKDVTMICEANGLYEPQKIQVIYNESEGDLRRIKTAVRKAHILSKEEPRLEVA